MKIEHEYSKLLLRQQKIKCLKNVKTYEKLINRNSSTKTSVIYVEKQMLSYESVLKKGRLKLTQHCFEDSSKTKIKMKIF